MVQNLVMDDIDHVEGLLRGNRVDEHVPMNPNKMLRVEHAVLVLRLYLVLDACPSTGPLTWPCVSIISVRNVWPFNWISWLNVFSMVG